METRLEDELRTTYDLAEVSASVDGRGRASLAVAPASKDLAGRVPEGYRAITVAALAPTGLVAGDQVDVETPATTVSGTVVSVTSTDSEEPQKRVTVAVPTADSRAVLESDDALLVAHSHDTSKEYEAFRLLENAGETVRKFVPDRSALDRIDDDATEIRPFAGRRSV